MNTFNPTNPKKVFTDASSAILLYKADLFSVLADAWQVVMAPSVFREITEPGYPGSVYFKSLGKKTGRSKIILQEPNPAGHPLSALKNFASMGQGEKETIQIFWDSAFDFKKTGSFILVDDGRAARFCHARQIPFINALLIPKVFWYSGFMDENQYLKMTALLCGLGRYSEKVMETARQFSQEDLNYFIGKDPHG